MPTTPLLVTLLASTGQGLPAAWAIAASYARQRRRVCRGASICCREGAAEIEPYANREKGSRIPGRVLGVLPRYHRIFGANVFQRMAIRTI